MGVLRTRARTPGSLGCTESLGSTRGGRVSHDYTHEFIRVMRESPREITRTCRRSTDTACGSSRRERDGKKCFYHAYIYVRRRRRRRLTHAPLPPSGPSVLPTTDNKAPTIHTREHERGPPRRAVERKRAREEGGDGTHVHQSRAPCVLTYYFYYYYINRTCADGGCRVEFGKSGGALRVPGETSLSSSNTPVYHRRPEGAWCWYCASP